jgi:hypothetical protein
MRNVSLELDYTAPLVLEARILKETVTGSDFLWKRVFGVTVSLGEGLENVISNGLRAGRLVIMRRDSVKIIMGN